ncbi:putative glycoside hydrolase [candidate division KSB1 bacterium]
MKAIQAVTVIAISFLMVGCGEDQSSRGLQWFQDSEVYNGWYHPAHNPPETEVLQNFPFIVWTQPTEHLEAVRELQAEGVRALPYISFYIGYSNPPTSDEPEYTGSWLHLESPYWSTMNIADHAEWVLIGADGKERWNFGYRQLCNNSPEFQETVETALRRLMDLGFDGVFIDNVHPDEQCYGPKFGRHEHVRPDDSHTDSFIRTLKLAQDVVKSYGADKVVLHNSGGPNKLFAPYADGSMWESYICSWAWPGRSLSWGKSDLTWEEVKQGAEQWSDYIESGKQVIALSYLYNFPGGTEATYGMKLYENAFLTYACARYSGFLWADWFTIGYDRARILYRVRLGKPISTMIDRDDIHLRQFEGGLVAINSGKTAFEGELEVETPCDKILDVYSYKHLDVDAGRIKVSIPAWSGRVYWVD